LSRSSNEIIAYGDSSFPKIVVGNPEHGLAGKSSAVKKEGAATEIEGNKGINNQEDNNRNNTDNSPGAATTATHGNLYIIWSYRGPKIMNEGQNASTNPLNKNASQYTSGIFFVKSADGGSTFSKPVNISGNEDSSSVDIVASDKDNLNVIWDSRTQTGDTNNPVGTDVLSRRSSDGGITFGPVVDLNDDKFLKTSLLLSGKPQRFFFSQTAASGSNVYVGWQISYPDSHELFLSVSRDYGKTFNIIRLEGATIPPKLGSALSTLGTISAIIGVAIAILVVLFKRRGVFIK
jgi:hypothetical protein